MVLTTGFEPAVAFAPDYKSGPFDRTRVTSAYQKQIRCVSYDYDPVIYGCNRDGGWGGNRTRSIYGFADHVVPTSTPSRI